MSGGRNAGGGGADGRAGGDRSESRGPGREPAEIAIVGAGPCGIAVGAAAARAGVRSILFDKGALTRSILAYPPYMTFFSTAEKLEIEDVPFIVAGGKPTRVDALVYYRRIARHFSLDVRQHHEVVAVEGEAGDFRVRTRDAGGEEEVARARAVVIATGGFDRPNRLDIPGEELPKVSHYFREPYPFWDRDVLVIGGGNSAVEAALELFRAGARTTIVHFADDFDAGVKPWVLPDIRNRLEEGAITVHWRARVEEIRHRTVLLRDAEGRNAPRTLANDHVFAMTGWRADPRLLADLGVGIDGATGVPQHDPVTMETPVPGVYIAGVIAAGHDANRIFIENGREHGKRILRALESSGRRR